MVLSIISTPFMLFSFFLDFFHSLIFLFSKCWNTRPDFWGCSHHCRIFTCFWGFFVQLVMKNKNNEIFSWVQLGKMDSSGISSYRSMKSCGKNFNPSCTLRLKYQKKYRFVLGPCTKNILYSFHILDEMYFASLLN